MKQFLLCVCVSSFSISAVHAQAKTKSVVAPKPKTIVAVPAVATGLKTHLDSFSYALGMNIANNLKMQSIDKINAAAMQKGMEDVFNQKAVVLTEQQANACIQTTLQAKASKKSEAEIGKGKAFLESNKKRAGVITLASGLQYEVITAGDKNSAMPKAVDTVVAHYAGTLIDGKEFDNSYKRGEPLTIPVGGVIRGWTEALQLMHVGDKWKVFIPSELGYGERGAGADIPGGAALIFEMELIAIKPAAVVADAEKK